MIRRIFAAVLCLFIAVTAAQAQEVTPEPTPEVTADPRLEATAVTTPESTEEVPTGYARVRLGHYVPSADRVDLYVNGVRVFSDVPYPITTNYLTVASGTAQIDIRRADGGSSLIPPFDVEIHAERAYTLALMDSITPVDSTDEPQDAPRYQAPLIDETAVVGTGIAGSARIILLNAIAPSTLTAGFGSSQPLAVPFGSRGIVSLPPGDFSLTVTLDSGARFENIISLRADLLYFIVIYGTADQPQPSLQVSGTRSIARLISESGAFSLFASLIRTADLMDVLDVDSPFTVFAPTNTAVEAFALERGIAVDVLLADPTLAASIVQAHTARGLMFTDSIATLALVPMNSGGDIVIAQDSIGLLLNGAARIVVPDVLATNGVIHAVDQVLLPDEVED